MLFEKHQHIGGCNVNGRFANTFLRELDFVLELDGTIVGHVMFMHAEIKADDGRIIPVMTFGPISIRPDLQRKGYGKMLLDHALVKTAEMCTDAVCMERNIRFYGHCGFGLASSRNIHYHAEPRESEVPYFLLRELRKGYLDGIEGVYKPPMGVLCR